MRIPCLVEVLEVLAVALVVPSGCGVDDTLFGKDCTTTAERTFDLEHPDPPTSFKIERCRVDVDACAPLCTYVLNQHGVTSIQGTTACDVEFEGAITHVVATYQVFNAGTSCPVPADDQPGAF